MAYDKVVDSAKLDADLTTVADAIREKTGSTERLSFPDGMAEAVGTLYEAGKQAEYDSFWNVITANWERTNYANAFSFWSKFINPPKMIVPTGLIGLFEHSLMTEFPNDCNIDFSKSTQLQAAFRYCRNLTYVSPIDCSSCIGANIMFLGCENLRKVTLNNIRPECTWTSAFAACYKIEELMVSGTIGTEFYVTSQTLVKSSIISIINALSATAADLTVTLSVAAVNNAFETTSGAADGSTSEEWLTLIDTKPNWTISLA